MTQSISRIKGVYRAIREPMDYENLSMSPSISMPSHLWFDDGDLLYASGKTITLKAALKRYPHFRDYHKPTLDEYWSLIPILSYPEIKLSPAFPDGFCKLSDMEVREEIGRIETKLHPEMRRILEGDLGEGF